MTRSSFSAALLGLLFLALTARGQQSIQYPYNPDVDNDEYIATSDLTGFLAQFGQDFQPAPVLIDSVDLLSVIQMMQAQITALQSQVASLEASVVPGLGDYVSVDDSAHTVLVSGANLQVVNGTDNQTQGNSLGNVVVGYNPVDSVEQYALRTGSHNLVVGSSHIFNGSCNIIGGKSNQTQGFYGIVTGEYNEFSGLGGGMIGGRYNVNSLNDGATLGGRDNTIDSDGGAIVGGRGNTVLREQAVVIAGAGNWIGNESGTNSRYAVICGGIDNAVNDGQYAGIFGGSFNEINGELGCSIAGNGNNVINGLAAGGQSNVAEGIHAVVVGGLNNHSQASWNSIVGGNNNTIGLGTDNCVIVGGESNSIQNYSTHSSVVGGQHNVIGAPGLDSRFAVISGGRFNTIEMGYSNAIFGGESNRQEVPTYEGDLSISSRSIFGGFANRNFAGFATSIVGGRQSIAELRDADDPTYIPTDCIIGSLGRAYLGSTTSSGGDLIDASPGQ